MSRAAPVALLLFAGSGLAAQSSSTERATDSRWAPWMIAWSPLEPIADLSRRLPRAPRNPDLLVAPPPSIGLFWTAGTPAAIALEMGEPRGELEGAAVWDDGTYRRPLDPDAGVVVQLAGLGWRPMGSGAAAGHVTVDQENLDPASFADVAQPFTSNPLVVTDTSVPRMRQVRVRMEGAFGWRFGAWGLGLAAGVEVRDHRSVDARFPRLERQSSPALSAGVARSLPFGGITAAAFGRFMASDETVTLVPQPGSGTVYQLEGYSEPDRRQVSQLPSYFRRLDRNAHALGLGMSGTIFGATWVVFGQREDRDEGHWSARQPDPPTDRWTADGWTLGAALQRRVLGERLLVTAHAGYATLDGAATRADLEGDIFRAHENALTGAVEARYATSGSPWQAALAVSLVREQRLREDFIALIHSDIEDWTPGVALEVARALGSNTAIAIGFAASAYSAVAAIPNPEPQGPVYQRVIAPELSLYASRAQPLAGSVTLRQQLSERTALVLQARHERLEPEAADAGLPLVPSGRRTLSSVSLGVVLER